ncbi:hypothetical protein LTR53_016139 [Teratosphaeriaceae sp. CCFEE 6253]|nr:hypothetical protein LTR53_016139 [Teratosphaeriaceae sp. CCFEE 6253]
MPGVNSTSIMVNITTNAPPDKVRQVLLDFERIPRRKMKQNIFNLAERTDAEPGHTLQMNSVQSGEVEAEITVCMRHQSKDVRCQQLISHL